MPAAGPAARTNPGGRTGVNVILPTIADADQDVLLDLVVGVVDAMYRHPSTGEALLRCGMPRREPPFLRASELAGRAPPAGTPLFIEQLGVLTVPCGELTVEEVREALAGSVPEGTVVEYITRARPTGQA
jgi:hypothetical protein